MPGDLDTLAKQSALEAAETELKQAQAELDWEMAKAGVDAAGLLDPTPTSDLIGMGMSLKDGDYLGAAMSGISLIPYAGDAIGKSVKAIRTSAKLKKITEKIAKLTAKINSLKKESKAVDDAKNVANKGDGIVEKSCTSGKKCSLNIADKTSERKDHILNRHRHGSNKPGKTEFPQGWSDDKIINEVNKIANDPTAKQGMGKYNSPYKIGKVDGVEIRVDFYPKDHPTKAGKVSTAYPINTKKNP
jgi:outer membrane murein-binding lipoprotein Lpp